LGDRDNHCQEEGRANSAWRDTRAFGGIGFGARFFPSAPYVEEEGDWE